MLSADIREHLFPRIRFMIQHHRLLAIAFVLGCGKSPRTENALANLDPAEAAMRVRKLAASCDGYRRALDQLATSKITGRALAGLVEEAITAARASCSALDSASRGRSAAHQLARARLVDDRNLQALAELTALDEPAIRYRRAELLDRLGRAPEALVELDAALARAPDEQGQSTRRLLQTSMLARAGNYAETARLIAAAPITERPNLAFRAAADTPVDSLAMLGLLEPPELAEAAADRLEQLAGPAAAVDVRALIASRAPDDADHWDALARAQIAAGRTDEALAAWDRAIKIAPAQPSFRLAPINALVIAGDVGRARARAAALAKLARGSSDIAMLETASAGMAASGDSKQAVELARAARAGRPGDGRLAFLVAQRLAELGEVAAAADAYAELLLCGAHDHPWHRHEVAGKLLQLGEGAPADARSQIVAALDAKRACTSVEPADLASYVERLRATLAP